MEKVLQHVGLAKKLDPSKYGQRREAEAAPRRRRSRSRSRGQAEARSGRSGGLFGFDWNPIKDCRACRSKAIGRRFCGKKADNQLYRSNSFKFERFIRGSEETSSLSKEISLCDDYSVPVDTKFGQNCSLRNARCAPAYCCDDSSLTASASRQFQTESSTFRAQEKQGSVSSRRDTQPRPAPSAPQCGSTNPLFPYYYADLFKRPSGEIAKRNTFSAIENSFPEKNGECCGRGRRAGDATAPRFRKSSSLGARELVRPEKGRAAPQVAPPPDGEEPVESEGPDDEDEEMPRQKHVYETAFDSSIDRRADDGDITNHPLLAQMEVQLEAKQSRSLKDSTEPSAPPQLLDSVTESVQNLHVSEPSPSYPDRQLDANSFRRRLFNLQLNPSSKMRDREEVPRRRSKNSRMSVFSQALAMKRANREAEEEKSKLKLKSGPQASDDPIMEFKGRPRRNLYLMKHPKRFLKRNKCSSSDSITSSSMESIRSSTSEGNRSTSSSESRQSTSLSSHSSDSDYRLPPLSTSALAQSGKLHILSPISDKSSLEPASEADAPRPQASPEASTSKRRMPHNKNVLRLEIQGSDSGISIQSREGIKVRVGPQPVELPGNVPTSLLQPKACRRLDISDESVNLAELPFDMPKLRRKLLVVDDDRAPGLSLDLSKPLRQITRGAIDLDLPLEKQSWFHGSIGRMEAEAVLKLLREGSFLVRNSESTKHDFSLSLKSAKGYLHMRIQRNKADGLFILGQFSKGFASVPEMILHYTLNRLPIRGAEHMCLLLPVEAPLL